MKEIEIEIENNKALQYLKHEIDQINNKLTEVMDMLAEICHNCDNTFIEKCYIERFETP